MPAGKFIGKLKVEYNELFGLFAILVIYMTFTTPVYIHYYVGKIQNKSELK